MIGLCNPSNQLCQLVRVVLPSVMLAAGAGGYRQSLGTEHCMALRDAVIGQRLDHVRRTAIQGYRAPGDEMRHKICSVSGTLPSAPSCIASLTCISLTCLKNRFAIYIFMYKHRKEIFLNSVIHRGLRRKQVVT